MRGRHVGAVIVIAATALACLAAAGTLIGPSAPVARFPAAGLGRKPATVSVYGAAGSFGSLGDQVPSGQSLARHEVPGWGLPPGRTAGHTVLAADGTVLMAGIDANDLFGVPNPGPTAAEAVIGAFRSDRNTYTAIRLRTTTGQEQVVDRRGAPAAPAIGDLEPLPGGAVAFTAAATGGGPDRAGAGQWPVFGILTTVDGRWQVAGGPAGPGQVVHGPGGSGQVAAQPAGSGPPPGSGRLARGAGWVNQWTGAALRATNPAVGRAACPGGPGAAGRGDCRGLTEIVTLPRSRHLIVTQYGAPGRQGGGLLALRVDGPDPAGRYTVAVTGHYAYPDVRNPSTADPDDRLEISPRMISADPSSAAGDERFTVGFDLRSKGEPAGPSVVQEFSYHAASGTIRPVSAPIISGDRAPGARPGEKGEFIGYGAFHYDHRGNLWVARQYGLLQGGALAVYAKADGRRRLGGSRCPYQAGRLPGSFRTTDDGLTVWGQSCPPDFDLVQAKDLHLAEAIAEDPVSHDIVLVAFGGTVLPIRPSGAGRAMTFVVGNTVDLGSKLLPAADLLFHRPGAIDSGHRLWIATAHRWEPASGDGTPARRAGWLYAVSLPDLFNPAPVELSDTPGRRTTVQAEYTMTTGTIRGRPGGATVRVDSRAYFGTCPAWPQGVGCGYDSTAGDGFVLLDDSHFGHLGGPVEYRIRVPTAGSYRLEFRASTFEVTTDARIDLSVAGRTYSTPIDTGGPYAMVAHPEPVQLPAGVHPVRLSAPDGRGGWYLNYFTLERY